MKTKAKTRRKRIKPTTITINAAASEINLDRRTLTRMLRAAGVEVGRQTTVSWRDIFKAVAGDPRIERVKELQARRKLLEFNLREKERDLVCLSEAQELINRAFLPIRQRFLALPSECCALVNPTDPQHARAQLQNWSDSALRLIREALPVPG